MRKIRSRKFICCIFGAQARKSEKYGPGSAFSAFSALWPGNAKNTVQEVHFLHFQNSGQEMRKKRSRKLIFCIFGAQARKCEKCGPGSSFSSFSELKPGNLKNTVQEALSAFSALWPGNAKNTVQEAHFLHFRISSQEMRKIRSGKLIFCIFGSQARKCEKHGPGSSFSAFSEFWPGSAKNTVQEAHFLRFRSSGQEMRRNTIQEAHFLYFRSSSQEMRRIQSRIIFCIFGAQARKCEKYDPGSSFSAFSEVRSRNAKNTVQEAHFLQFRSSGQFLFLILEVANA